MRALHVINFSSLDGRYGVPQRVAESHIRSLRNKGEEADLLALSDRSVHDQKNGTKCSRVRPDSHSLVQRFDDFNSGFSFYTSKKTDIYTTSWNAAKSLRLSETHF